MKLYFIRHGETVDNVAGLYAGVRDSALTNHGVEQTRWLGEHFAKNGVKLTHVFSSPLSRARTTASALIASQPQPPENGEARSLEIVEVPDLIEQDFGSYEGKPFSSRAWSSPTKGGRAAHDDERKADAGLVDAESRASMTKRADRFLDQHLLSLLQPPGSTPDNREVAIISHGILLTHLWRRLLLRLPRKSVTVGPEVTATRGNLVLEHLGVWSNTGYLELLLSFDSPSVTPHITPITSAPPATRADIETMPPAVPPAVRVDDAAVPLTTAPSEKSSRMPTAPSTAGILHGWRTVIVAIDSKQHLTGLKRQRGGIGRLAHDAGQKKLDGFFKRRRAD